MFMFTFQSSTIRNKPTCAMVAAMTSVAHNKNKQYTFNAKVDFTLLLPYAWCSIGKLSGFWHNAYPWYTPMRVCINFQISTFLGSVLIPRFSRVSSKESKRTLVVSERRKVCINFQISTFLGSVLTPGFSRASFKESKRTLVVPERSLGGFWHNGCP